MLVCANDIVLFRLSDGFAEVGFDPLRVAFESLVAVLHRLGELSQSNVNLRPYMVIASVYDW